MTFFGHRKTKNRAEKKVSAFKNLKFYILFGAQNVPKAETGKPKTPKSKWNKSNKKINVTPPISIKIWNFCHVQAAKD